MNKNEKLLKKIEYLRQELNELTKTRGYTDREVLKLSQKLDSELNTYEKLNTEKLHTETERSVL